MDMACESMGRPIAILYRQFIRYITAALRDTGISAAECVFLPALYHEDGQSQEHLSACLQIDKAATARAVKTLADKGFVTRLRDDRDKRILRVYLTEKGRVLEPLIFRALEGWNSLLAERLEPGEADRMRTALQDMANRMAAADFDAYLGGGDKI